MLVSESDPPYNVLGMKLPADRVSQLRTFYQGRQVCVTGGSGFIGGHLIDALVSLGASIAVIDDLSNSNLENLAPLIEMEPDRVRFIHGSILDDAALRDACDGARTVFHLAALGSVPKSVEQPQRTWSVNTTGTLRVLEAARNAPVERVVFAASSSAYGDQPELPKVETQMPQVLSPYGASKLAGEHLLATWAHCYGLSTVGLRYFNIFGPRQSSDSAYAAVIAAFAKNLSNGKAPLIFGDGAQTRDFTFVDNAVLATLLAGATTKPLKGDIMNIGTGRRVSVTDLAVLMADRFNQPQLRPIYQPARPGDVKHSVADITKARTLLGYEPFAPLEQGLTETIEWFKRSLAKA